MASRKTKKNVAQSHQFSQNLALFEQVLAGALLFLTLLAPYYRGLYFRLERYPFCLVVCAIGIIFGVLRMVRRASLTVPALPLLFLSLFVFLYGVNVFFSAHHGLAHQEFVNWGVYILFLAFWCSAEFPIPFGTFLLLFGANGVILTILGLLQAFGGIAQNTVFLGMSLFGMFEGGRLHATFQYPNTASAYFGMGIFALLGVVLLSDEKPWKKNLALFLAFLVLGGLFFTYSRGGMLVVALAFLISLLLFPPKARASLFTSLVAIVPTFFVLVSLLEGFLTTRKPLLFFSLLIVGGVISGLLRNLLTSLEVKVASLSRGKFVLLVGLLFVAVCVLLVIGVQFAILGRQAERLLDISLRTRNVWERLVFYRDGLKLFAQRPLNGWGGGGWEGLYFSVRSFPYFTRSTHNLYLQILIEGGILGILLLGSFLYLLFRGILTKFAKETSPIPAILSGLLFLAFLHGFVDVDFNLGAYQLTVWLFVGFALQTVIVRERGIFLRIPPILYTGACLFFLILSTFYILSEGHRKLGDYAMQRGDWQTAIFAYEKALRFEPWDPDLHRALSTALREAFLEKRDVSLRKRSIEEGEIALRLAPRNAATLEHLGVLYVERGAFEEAFRLLERAIENNPFEIHIYLSFARAARATGEYLLKRGEKEKALGYLKRGLEVERLLEKAASSSLEPITWDTGEVTKTLAEIRDLLRYAEE